MGQEKTNIHPLENVPSKKVFHSKDLLPSVLERLTRSGYSKESDEYKYFESTPFSQLNKDIKKGWLMDEIEQTLTAGIRHRKLSKNESIETKSSAHLEKILSYIDTYYCTDFTKLQDFIISPKEYLIKFIFLDKTVILPFHPNSESIIIDDLSRHNGLKKRIKTGEEKLKEEVDTESYMDGNLIIVYKTMRKTAENGLLPALALWGATGVAQGGARALDISARSMVGRELLGAARGALDPWIELSRKIDKIFYKDIDGKMQSVDVSQLGQLNIEKGIVPSNLLGLLEQKGIVMDPATGRFSPLAHLTMRDVVRNFEYMQAPEGVHPEDWKKFQADIRALEIEYREGVKTGKISSSITALKEFLDNKFTRGGLKTAKWIKSKLLHVVFWPVFFKKYHANMQDRGARNAALSEVGLFMSGAKLGSKLPVPPLFKPVTGLVAGGMAVMAGEHIAEMTDLDKKYWLLDPEREDFAYKADKKQDGNSITGNMLSGGFVYRFLDKGKSDFAVTPKGGIDLRIGYNQPTLIDGKLVLQRKELRDLYLPRIAFLETSISFQTNPREYMGAAMGRDVGLWNKRVEEYRVWLTQVLESLHEEYKKQEGIFRIANIQKVEIDPDSDFYQTHIVGRQVDPNDPEQKNIPTVLAYDKVSKKLVPVERYDEMEMRRKYLYGIRIMQMLGADGYENLKKMWSAPQSVQNSYIMRSISNRATDWVGYRDETRKQNTGMLVANMVDQLRIDEEYIRRETLDLRTRELAIIERLGAFAKQFQGKQQAYVLDLFRRIRAKEKMVELNLPPDVKPLRPVANGVIVHTGPGKGDIIPNRGGTRGDTKLVASMEWTWWKELLESKEIYKPQDQGEDYSALEKIEGKNLDKAISSDALDLDKILGAFDLKIGDVFFQLLKDMVEFKRQEEFVRNIQKYGTGQKWYGPNVFDSIYK